IGYDMIELHGAHGYLINQFISPFMNKRTDEYGGSLENRMRFALETIKTVQQAVGQGFPIGFRISAIDFVPGGITLEESTVIARMLEAAGVACISVSAGIFETADRFTDLMQDPEGWKEYTFEAIKKSVKIPVIAGGSLRHPDFCERLLEQGKADLIGLARPLFADPEWPKKTREGRVEDIRLCISCNECIAGSGRRRQGGGARRCAVNATAGREREFAEIKPVPVSKKVMVIGGGPGGMEAARIAAMRGHKVTIYEKGEALGGALLIASRPQSKRKILWLRDYLVAQLKRLGVDIEPGIEVTPRMVTEVKPDAVVVATGAEPIMPDIPGINQKHVVSALDIIQEKVKPEKERVVILGGGMIGCEVAEYLLESKNSVTIIEQLPAMASDMEPYHRYRLLELLKENNVTVLTRRKVVGVAENAVQIANLDSQQEELVEADRAVVAMGARPLDSLADALKGKVQELYFIGDCSQPRSIMEAIYEGALAGRQI
ncbi:FAD-dependent oxidoreductase, partial [Chloroflexota bacterium]